MNEDVPVPFHVILPLTPLAVVPLVVYVATSTPEPPVIAGLLQPPKVLFAVCLPAVEVVGLNVALVQTVGVAAPAVVASGTIKREPAASATAIIRVGTRATHESSSRQSVRTAIGIAPLGESARLMGRSQHSLAAAHGTRNIRPVSYLKRPPPLAPDAGAVWALPGHDSTQLAGV